VSQHPLKNSDSSFYRFIDDGIDIELPGDDARILRVEFYQSIDDYVSISEKAAKEFPLPSFGKLSLQAFVVLNQIGTPAILFYFGLWLPALVVFALNMTLAVAVLPMMLRVDFRRFYRQHFKDLERGIATMELHPRGVWFQAGTSSSFISWDNFTSIEERDEAIFFFMVGGGGIPVRKNGFAYQDEKDQFLSLALKRLREQRSLNERTDI
jgi:YcxB-like protein